MFELDFFFSFAVSLQVDIVPSQGEISVGESKFFLCQGKCPGWVLSRPKACLQSLLLRVQAESTKPRILVTALLLVSSVTIPDHSQRPSLPSDMPSTLLLDTGATQRAL